MTQFLKSFLRYYTASQPVEIPSHYDAAGSLSRILDLDTRGEIRVWRTKGERLMACGAQWKRSNVQPLFEGQLESQSGQIVLRGRIGIDPGIRVVLGFFSFIIFIFFPLRLGTLLGGTQVSGNAPYIVAPLCFVGLLTVFYLVGRTDPAKILKNLNRALNQSDGN
jgi:hypothetical protein